MKFTILAALTVAAVSAQSIADIPACAQTCLLPALQATGCSLTDFKCSCSNSAFVSGSTACIQKSCSAADQAKAAQATYELCKSAGVTISTAVVAESSTSAAAPASSSSAAAAPSSSAAAVTTSSVAAPSSYGAATTKSTKTVDLTTTVTTCTTSTSATYAAGNGTHSTTPAAPAYTGGASSFVAPAVLAAAGAVGAFFL